MSDSDNLSVQLWFGAAAITFMAIAMSAAGWNHKYFVWSMFTLAGATVVVAVFYRSIKTLIPPRWEDVIVLIANDHRAWFVMFTIGIFAVLFVTKIPRIGLSFSLESDVASKLQGLQTFPGGIIFIQVHVKTRRRLTNCRAWIYPIEYKSAGGNYDVEHSERLPSEWSWAVTQNPYVCDIDRPTPAVFNVAKILGGALQMHPQTPTNLATLLQRHGTHRFTVHVVGYVGNKTRSKTKRLLVSWNGNPTPAISLE
jgi:hypothetical protein